MQKSKSIKHRLIASVLVLVLLFSSLLGTTFAWFTDSVTSEGNTIKTGTLKIDLLHKSGDEWISVKENPNHKIFNYDNWEPGYTRVETLKAANLGTLALQYKLSLTVEAGTETLGANGENLADVIEVYVSYGDNTAASYDAITNSTEWSYKGTLTEVMSNPATFIGGQLLPAGATLDGAAASSTAVESQTLSVALHMQESAGNEYQKLAVGNIYVNVIATQWSYENDSFDNNYDNDVVFPYAPGALYSASASVVTDGNGSVTTAVNVGNDSDLAKAVIAAGTKLEPGVNEVTLDISVVEDYEAVVEINAQSVVFPLDVHIEGISSDNTVPVTVQVNNVFPKGLAYYNVQLYHVENGVTVAMTSVSDISELDAHNEFYYDPTTGVIVVSMATFSEVTATVAVDNPWNGVDVDYSWYDASKTEFVLEDVEDFVGFARIVGGMAPDIAIDEFNGKTVKLASDINLGGSNGVIFYPVGYHNSTGSFEHITGGDVTSNVSSFEGIFDGQGYKITNILQRTWDMFGDYNSGYEGTPNYYKDGMGIFGFVYNGTVKNLTVENFQSDGEFCTTGCVAAYSAGHSTFENIRITNCNPRAYNVPNGGVVGYAYDESASENGNSITFKNVVVDHTTKITALWGSWDVACGGILGRLGDTTKLTMDNCTVGAIMDVYNDVCANYQYYDFRYAGILIGTVGSDGDTTDQQPNMTFNDCKVYYGSWSNDYHYYCELVENSIASYTHDYQFSRLTKVGSVSELRDLQGNWNRTGNFVVVDGDGTTCYHIRKDANGNFYEYKHEDAGYETVDGETVLVENNQCVHIPFKQLYTGYGWGASAVAGNTEVAEAKYIVTYMYEGSVIDVVYVTDNSTAFNTSNSEIEKYVTDITGNEYEFDAWVNAGGNIVSQIDAGNTENVTLYVTWKAYHVARFVDQHGNVIYEAAFKRGDTAIVGEPAVPEIEYCTGKWEDYTEKLRTATGDIVIYPIYEIESSHLTIVGVDEDDDGDFEYYIIKSVNSMTGTDGTVNIPGYINGVQVKIVETLSATVQGNVITIKVQEGVEQLNAKSFASTPDMTEVWLPNTIKSIGSNAFSIQGQDKKDALTIHYDGTKAEWESIQKPNDWAKGMRGGSKIVCTDYTGEFQNNGSITWKANTN